MGKDWLVCGKWLGPLRGGGKGDREAQYQRQLEKRRLARQAAALAAAGKPNRERRGRPQGPQKRRCSKSTGGLPAERAQCQKTPWMIRRRLRGKQTPMGLTVFAKAAQATATHATAMADHAHKETRCANATKEEAEAQVAVAVAALTALNARAEAAEADAAASRAAEEAERCRRLGVEARNVALRRRQSAEDSAQWAALRLRGLPPQFE